MLRRRKITWICLIGLAVAIKIFSWYPTVVERWYSRGFYPPVSRLQRLIFGWIPFSIGDILYGAVVILLAYRLVRLIRQLIRKEAKKGWLLSLLRQTAYVLLWVYVLFNLLWGLNYNRLGIADQLGLRVKQYTDADLYELTAVVVDELNALHDPAKAGRGGLGHLGSLRAGAVEAYDSLAGLFPDLAYRHPSFKPSLFSYPGLYIGFAGYINPFTGEAQVNAMDPLVSLPFSACHEIGHQVGYAKEDEANFIGFMAARSSPDPAFQYSLYLDLYRYGVRELYVRDSTLAKGLRDKLAPGVREDLRELQRFNRRYENPIEPWIWSIYGRYLKANRQPQGIVTYSELTAWLIAYGKKFGPEAIRPRWEVASPASGAGQPASLRPGQPASLRLH